MDRKDYDKQRDDKRKETRFVDKWYGIVFGVNGKVNEYFKDNCKSEQFIYLRDNDLHCNPQYACKDYEAVKDDQQYKAFRWMLTKVCEQSRKFENQLLTFHNGNNDNECEYNGYHWHWMVHAKVHPTRDSRWGRSILDNCVKQSLGWIYFASEEVRVAHALAHHILTKPRIPIWVKGTEMKCLFESAGQGFDPTVDKIANQKAKIQESKNYHRMTFLTELMDKYQTPDMTTLKQRIKTNENEWNQLRLMMAEPSWDTLIKKAMELHRTKVAYRSLDEVMATDLQHVLDWSRYYSVSKSLKIFQQWITFQEFDRDAFLIDLFATLGKRRPKRNTFCLMGPANCGKSYILRSIVKLYTYFGDIQGADASYAFAFGDCLDCGVIFIEEPAFLREKAEIAKKIFEGEATYVNVKNKGAGLLQPTPVLVTTNNPVWQYAPENAAAFKARMYIYHCKQMEDLKHYNKMINPLIWSYLWKTEIKTKLDQKIAQETLQNCTQETSDDDELVAEAIRAELDSYTRKVEPILIDEDSDKETIDETQPGTPENTKKITTPGAPKRKRFCEYCGCTVSNCVCDVLSDMEKTDPLDWEHPEHISKKKKGVAALADTSSASLGDIQPTNEDDDYIEASQYPSTKEQEKRGFVAYGQESQSFLE